MHKDIKKLRKLLSQFSNEQIDYIFEQTRASLQAKIDKCPRCIKCGGFAKWKSKGVYYDYCFGEVCEELGYNNGCYNGIRFDMSTRTRFIIGCEILNGTYVKEITKVDNKIDSIVFTSNPKESKMWMRKIEPIRVIEEYNRANPVFRLKIHAYSSKTGVQNIEIPQLPKR